MPDCLFEGVAFAFGGIPFVRSDGLRDRKSDSSRLGVWPCPHELRKEKDIQMYANKAPHGFRWRVPDCCMAPGMVTH